MSRFLPVDHHATFKGWAADKSAEKSDRMEWSSRRSVSFILISALASWVLVLSPFFLFE